MQHDAPHRRMLEKRQRVVITTVITRPLTTVTAVATVIRRPTTSTTLPASRTPVPSSSSSLSALPSSGSSSLPSSASSSSTLPSTTSSSTPAPTPTDRAITSPPATTPPSVITVTKTFSPVPSARTSNSVSAASNTSSSSSAGGLIGIIVGAIVGALGLALVVWFLVRHFKKRAQDKDVWNASKFRQSALQLDDPLGEKKPFNLNPRPPSMLERKAIAASNMSLNAPSMAYPYSDSASQYSTEQQQQNGVGSGNGNGVAGFSGRGGAMGVGVGAAAGMGVGADRQPQQYGSPNPFGAAPIPYTGQNMYGNGAGGGAGGFGGYAGSGYAAGPHGPQQGQQGMELGYGMRNHNPHNSLPPFSSYAPQRVGTNGNSNLNPNSIGGTTNAGLPNPFSDRPPQILPSDFSTSGSNSMSSALSSSSSSSNASRLALRNGSDEEGARGGLQTEGPGFGQRQEQGQGYMTLHRGSLEDNNGEAPPPAYSDDGSYAAVRRDEKGRVVMSVEAAGGATGTVAGNTGGANGAAIGNANVGATGNGNANAASAAPTRARPVSAHTVYDPDDAYGGM